MTCHRGPVLTSAVYGRQMLSICQRIGQSCGGVNQGHHFRSDGTHEDQGDVQILLVPFDEVGVVLCGFLLIHGVKISSWVARPGGFEKQA